MKNIRKRVAVLLSAILLIALTTPTSGALSGQANNKVTGIESTPSVPTFTDVPPESWYTEPVVWAIEQGITNGTSATTFSPNDTCSNAQVLTFLWRACESPKPTISNPFSDVSERDYYYQAALWAYENEMVEGDIFQPDKPCSRSMAVTYLWREAGSPRTSSEHDFTDVGSDADYVHAVVWAVEMGVTNGTTETTFSPNTTCTRAQIITFLWRDLAEDLLSDSDFDHLDIKV